MSVTSFVSSNRSAISMIFLFSVLLYSYEKGKKVVKLISERRQASRKREQSTNAIIAHLDGLNPQESAWIYFCLRENVRTLLAVEINPIAISLENKLIVYRPNTIYDILATPFTLRPEVWKYLNENRERFCSVAQLADQAYNLKVNDLVISLRSVI